jgi:hypothetical protein
MSWADVIDTVNRGFVGEAVPGGPIPTPTFSDLDSAVQQLPARSREKFFTLRQKAADNRAAVEAAMNARDEAWKQTADLERQVRHLQAPHARGGFQRPPTDAEVMRTQGKLDAAKDRRARAVAHLDKIAKETLSAVLEKADRFLLGGGVHSEFTGALPAPPRGETPAATVTRMRGTIDNLKRDRAKVARAPVPMQLALDRAREQIAKLAALGAPRVGALFGRDERFTSIEWPNNNLRLNLYGDGVLPDRTLARLIGNAAGDSVDTHAFLCFLFQDEVQKRVEQLIRQSANEQDALDGRQLAARRAQLSAELLIAERCEVVSLERAEVEGSMIALRPDIDIRALLWLN